LSALVPGVKRVVKYQHCTTCVTARARTARARQAVRIAFELGNFTGCPFTIARSTVVVALLAALALGGCAATDTSTDSQLPAVQREYRTGSKFPVKESGPPLTPEERQRQIDEARTAAQNSLNQQPRGAKGQ